MITGGNVNSSHTFWIQNTIDMEERWRYYFGTDSKDIDLALHGFKLNSRHDEKVTIVDWHLNSFFIIDINWFWSQFDQIILNNLESLIIGLIHSNATIRNNLADGVNLLKVPVI